MNYESIEYKGYTINVEYNQDPANPRTEWNNVCTMVCFHSRYNLGDMERFGKSYRPISENYREPIDLLYELASVDRDEYQEKQYEECGEYNDMDNADLYRLIEERGTLISSLYLYDHSGITISMSGFSCPWDSGQVGWIYVTKETIEKEWGGDVESAKKYMEGEVEVYDNYLTGEVYGFRIEDPDGNEMDSCWGYYGDSGKDDMIKECENTIDYYLEKKEKKDLALGIQLELAL